MDWYKIPLENVNKIKFSVSGIESSSDDVG
jgi:hypothetical protein